MNTKRFKKDWLVVVVGAAVVASGLAVRNGLVEQQRSSSRAEALNAALSQIYQDQNISVVLRQLQAGDVGAARQRLDRLLCGNILHLEKEFGSADAETRTCVSEAWRRIARVRPQPALDGSAPEPTPDQIAAQRILTEALAQEVAVN
jgi:hypothetical protein